ncbi:MAG: biotin/lipoyl-binding protein, partial [Methylomonas sp.]|nr:biotin/lipoyl-binding protein [Methylomonas sp.]
MFKQIYKFAPATLCLTVLAQPLYAEDAAPVRGLLKPLHEATLSSEILAKIAELPFREGKRFKKGDLLVRFDCARYKAEQAAAQAEYTARKKTSDNNAELATYNAAATLQVEVSAAETAKASAQL